MNEYGVIVTSVLLASILGNVFETILAMMLFAVFRKYSGGFHFNNIDVCFLVTTALFVIPPMIKLPVDVLTALNLISLIVVTGKIRGKMSNKIVCLVIVGAGFMLQSSAVSITIVAACILLLRGGEAVERTTSEYPRPLS
ncbi:accessory gene regulator B family protein [Paenibacillus hexagrammi]|uniref:accessory gene regulator B family protein n=1 Tax=Paenibacillus hexagrammi TaxID=2908839 RepID=UPI00331305F9